MGGHFILNYYDRIKCWRKYKLSTDQLSISIRFPHAAPCIIEFDAKNMRTSLPRIFFYFILWLVLSSFPTIDLKHRGVCIKISNYYKSHLLYASKNQTHTRELKKKHNGWWNHFEFETLNKSFVADASLCSCVNASFCASIILICCGSGCCCCCCFCLDLSFNSACACKMLREAVIQYNGIRNNGH